MYDSSFIDRTDDGDTIFGNENFSSRRNYAGDRLWHNSLNLDRTVLT